VHTTAGFMSGRDRGTPPFDALTKRTDKLHGQMMKEENRLKTNFKGELCYQILQEKHPIPPWLPRTWPQTHFKGEMSREKWLLRFPDKTFNEQRSLTHCFGSVRRRCQHPTTGLCYP